MPEGPARLRLPAGLTPVFAAAGWAEGDSPAPAAAGLFAALRSGPDPEGALARLASLFIADPGLGPEALAEPRIGRALVALAGASPALCRPSLFDRKALRRAVTGIPPAAFDLPIGGTEAAAAAIRRRVAARLLAVAAVDLTGRLDMPGVGAALSEAADEAAAAALGALTGEIGDCPPFTVMAMGKWGGRELNYASDIDLLFVYAVPEGADPEEAGGTAQRLAAAFIDCLSRRTPEGAAYRVDAGLRPEGRSGPLARTIESYRAYWERWARPWELQALVKARTAAGDAALGGAFLEAAAPFVYPEVLAPEALREVRAMKARAEEAAARRGEEIKRGVGGIRDIEFAVQLLQLVHGRADPLLRGGHTLEALRALGAAGYVSADDAVALEEAYRWLRDVEHRLQLAGLRRTHQVPAAAGARERLAKSLGYRDGPGATARERFDADLMARRAEVRAIHERLFYRPLLEAFAAAPATHPTAEGAVRQLAALGFQDVAGARRAFEELTAGLSRRSRLMQQLLPLMLGWLSASPDPDLGLEQLRLLAATTSGHAALIPALRDNPVAAERLCTLLGTSRLLGKLLDRLPPALARLGDDGALAAFPKREALIAEAMRRTAVRPRWEDTVAGLHRFVEAHVLWLAARDLVGSADTAAVGEQLSDLADAAVAAALEAARRRAAAAGPLPALAVIAVGRWGGREMHYASDLDALVVFRAGADPAEDQAAAQRVTSLLLEALGPRGPLGTALSLDLALRPEGKQGPAARSLDAYAAYWDRWAETWEVQALLRARPAAGDRALGAEFIAASHARVYRPGFGPDEERAVRHMKARIERERLPAQEDPLFHTKLGRGALADVEWAVQLLQLRHGHALPAARAPGTLAAMSALEAAGLMDPTHAAALRAAFGFCSRVRNRLFLQEGRPRDSLPADPAGVTRLARSLGYEGIPRAGLREEYRRVTRRARRVFEEVFYGARPGAEGPFNAPRPGPEPAP
ncbi:MAG: bifunctional [glutamine synthetase] adenylyltransferase/[glutamine synthetase]-adenylyl-L-tyrosine phosphorylase [Acidimicrobiia bacterium]|nr:bifunctional [glutamine synthetase] adenylyltransferase/[glutamine synthetase]-adenylyl-L-tyrosine phosphorylase [Acidimicrobiia bacterium]